MSPPPSPNRSSKRVASFWTAPKLAIAAFVVVALAGIALVALHLLPIRMCLAVLPANTQAGIGLKFQGLSSTIDVTSETQSQGAQNHLQTTGFLQCIQAIKGTVVVDRNQSDIGPSTLGQIVDQWGSDVDAFRVYLASNDQALQNFHIGPARGHKSEVMKSWCAANSKCVSCSPEPGDPQSTSTTVALKPGVQPERLPMASNAPWREPAGTVPYMDIKDGVRYSYQCTR
ncbi:hypothetical protein [Hydrogenophaga sp.]|jgi:hypothetical protein|uniref:hypothetical protein n=1 Tax=Hydrogenophaga sp. TaxID=1904254 RepID=UPI003F7229F7